MKRTLIRCLTVACVCLPLSALAGNAIQAMQGNLVSLRDGKMVQAKDINLADKKYVALYYSAHWCPPCRTFTPKLAEFYDAASKKHPEFELVLISSDRSEEAMQEYLAWGKMHFPALAYSLRRDPSVTQHGASGIPYLVVLDRNGTQILGKRTDEDWKYPGDVLEEFKALLAKE
jgi:nucleoredoxin